MILRLLSGALAIVVLVGATWFAAATYTARQMEAGGNTAAVERTVQAFLLRQPEVIVEAMQRLQAKRQEAAEGQRITMLRELKAELRADPRSPVGGNPAGDVTLVQFFDYRCPYCRHAAPIVRTLAERDPKLRIVYKELPVLGHDSTEASRLALAVFLTAPAQYEALHEALYAFRGQVTPDIVLAHVAEMKLDRAAIQKLAQEDEVTGLIQYNLVLAQKLGLEGTPAYLIGDTIIRGFVEGLQLQLAIQQARRACASC